MSETYAWQCECGAMKGGLSHGSGPVNRLVWYCEDCQAFAHYLDRAEDVLDAAGGTDIAQMSPARLSIREGGAHLACVRLSEKGIYRWYAQCCRTPIGNTGAYGLPFVGVIHGLLVENERADAVLGEVGVHVQVGFATGEIDSGASGFSIGTLVKFFRIIFGAKFSGAQRQGPFFDVATKAPVVVPTVLNEAAREELLSKVAS